MRAERPIDLKPDIVPVIRRRSSKETILRAAIEGVSIHGSDRLTASEIIASAGVSRSTLYGYFGDVREILAEIWAIAGAEWLHGLSARPLVATPALSSFDAALLDILAVSPRITELRELVLPDAAALRDVASGNPVEEARRTWVLATTIGIALSAPVLRNVSSLEFLVDVFASIPDDAVDRYDITPATRPAAPETSDAFPVTGESTTDRLLRASIAVVGQSGYHAATMTRVCRVARLTAGAAAPLFESLTDLHDRGFASMLRNVVDENTRGFRSLAIQSVGAGADAYAAFTQIMVHPGRSVWRRYRHELYVAARTSPDLADKMRAGFADTSRTFAAMLVETGATPRQAEFLVLVNQVISLGMAFVGELGFPVATIDHRLASRHFWLTVVDALAD